LYGSLIDIFEHEGSTNVILLTNIERFTCLAVWITMPMIYTKFTRNGLNGGFRNLVANECLGAVLLGERDNSIRIDDIRHKNSELLLLSVIELGISSLEAMVDTKNEDSAAHGAPNGAAQARRAAGEPSP
jgi:hypothetical protein